MKTIYNNKNLDIKIQAIKASVSDGIQAERFVFITWGDSTFRYISGERMNDNFVYYICNMITAAEYDEVIAAIYKACGFNL